MTTPPKPMLAISHTDVFPDNLDNFPWHEFFMMPKLDGIRAVTHNGTLWSRTGKPIRNKYIQQKFKDLPDGLDGELYVHHFPFHKISSWVMGTDTVEGMHIEYHVFDSTDPTRSASNRLASITEQVVGYPDAFVVPHIRVSSYAEFQEQDTKFIAAGYEGSMLKRIEAGYKHGRAGKSKQELIKIKQVETSDMCVTGVEYLNHNLNEVVTDTHGVSKRRQIKSGTQADTSLIGVVVGIGIADDAFKGHTIRVGSGFTTEQRRVMAQTDMAGKVLEFKHYPGGKDTVRQPIFLRFRDNE